jgi:hypothetical protein
MGCGNGWQADGAAVTIDGKSLEVSIGETARVPRKDIEPEFSAIGGLASRFDPAPHARTWWWNKWWNRNRHSLEKHWSCPSMWCKFGCGHRAAFSGGLGCNL